MNDTLSGNTAATGGAIANESSGTLSVLDSTLSSNTATTERRRDRERRRPRRP